MRAALASFPVMQEHEGRLVPHGNPLVYRASAPYTIYLLAAVAEEAGVEVDLHDWISTDCDIDAAARVLAEYDVVLISAMSWTWLPAQRVIDAVKAQRPETIIVVGGVHAMLSGEAILRQTPVDIVVRGEGERSLVPLLQAIQQGRELGDVPGLFYTAGGEIRRTEPAPLLTPQELARLPLPLYDRLPAGACNLLAVESSRGCNNRCTYCSRPFPGVWRALPAQAFVDRVEASIPYLDRVEKGKLLVVDDSFSVDVRRTTAIGRELERRRLAVRLYWNAQIPNLHVSEMLQAMAPFTDGILVGAESFDEETIRRIGKRFSASDIVTAVQTAQRLGLDHTLIVSFIIGYPWHTKADVIREIDHVFELLSSSKITVTLNWLTLNPGSEMWSDRYGEEEPPQREFGRLYNRWIREGVGLPMDEVAEVNRYLAYLKHSLGADAYRLQPRSGIFELMT